MRKTLIALVICAVTLSAMAATTAVSAKQAGTSDIRQYDILSWMAGDRVVGKLTVNFATGHYVVNANYGKGGIKDAAKQEPAESGIIKAQNPNANPWEITFGSVTKNKGGNAHGEGTLINAINHPDVNVVDWLNANGSGAKIYLNIPPVP